MVARRLVGRVIGMFSFDEVRLLHALLRSGPPGLMVDVGAHVGGALQPFVEDGWTVHAFEPDPDNRRQLLELVGGHPSVSVDERAISEIDDERVDLFTSPISTGISSLSPFHESHVPTSTTTTVRLATYLLDRQVDDVAFLKVDVEGHDLFVLRSFPWERMRPRALVCEFEDRKTKPLGYSMTDTAAFLVDHGYRVFVSEWYPVVEYGTHHRWRSLTPYPAPLADEDGWGNLIAVEPGLARPLMRRARLSLPWYSPARWRPPRTVPGSARRGSG